MIHITYKKAKGIGKKHDHKEHKSAKKRIANVSNLDLDGSKALSICGVNRQNLRPASKQNRDTWLVS